MVRIITFVNRVDETDLLITNIRVKYNREIDEDEEEESFVDLPVGSKRPRPDFGFNQNRAVTVEQITPGVRIEAGQTVNVRFNLYLPPDATNERVIYMFRGVKYRVNGLGQTVILTNRLIN